MQPVLKVKYLIDQTRKQYDVKVHPFLRISCLICSGY